MSETMTVKIAELGRTIFAVAYVSLETGSVTVWEQGSRLLTLTTQGQDANLDARDLATNVLRSVGWSVATDWTRPSAEWQEFRANVVGFAYDA